MIEATRRQALGLSLGLAAATSAGLAGCKAPNPAESIDPDAPETTQVRILATSDLHGKMMPWDYPLDEEDVTGSMVQLASAIKELRDDHTLLIDAGDTIQDNMAEIFVEDSTHPMMQCLNALGYDVWVTGNHEYNYGMDVTRKTVASFAGTALTGNVIDESGAPLADAYTIKDVGGVRVGIIGMVTPIITRWDEHNLEGCKVLSPLDETRKAIDQIAGDTDVLVGVYHMGLNNEYDESGSGVTDIANAFPEFDVIVAAHDHTLIEDDRINDVLVVENESHAQSLVDIVLTLERVGDGWRVTDRSSKGVDVGTYEPDSSLMEQMAPYDERAKVYAHEVVGELVGGPLAPENEIEGIPTAVIQDTALIDLVNTVQLHYAKADVSVASLFDRDSNLTPGDIRRCDLSHIYKHNNTLYRVQMTGAQLKTYMEWSAAYYRKYQPGDLTLAFDPEKRIYYYDMFAGVNYEVNVANEPGSRIENLTWPDGKKIAKKDRLVLAVNNYRATSALLTPGSVFAEDEKLPKLLEIDVQSDLGGVRDMICDYIEHVKKGTIEPELTENWRIVGNDWDPKLHAKAVELLAEGKLTLPAGEDERDLTPGAITEEDVKGVA